jgi:hypothetical protein
LGKSGSGGSGTGGVKSLEEISAITDPEEHAQEYGKWVNAQLED